ncbi:Acetylajmalan esterase [Camellia lanceoleosa]|uniref:Acetylajmalan esterase n=1 Tax=Camellia lanceoleosa TaxID=1840588 RepID=A0ACC0I964_9ERIC|nr:Acetylajmalan esterase [Camellia lanceoleosa]
MATTTTRIVLSLSLYKVTFMSSSFFLLLLLLLLLHLQTHLVLGDANGLKTCGFDRIYQFGDSMSDTGNLVRESAVGANTSFARLPYGQTFFHNATGRCSDGRLMIDFFAMAAGLPFLDPYLNTDGDFRHGANFAVASSTALPVEVLANKNILTMYTNSSLSVQLNWMSTHFYSIFHAEEDYGDKLKNSLFMLGETGGNDYNYAFVQGKTNAEVKSMVPEVVQAIVDAVRKVIHYGAVRVVVPGNFPIGCFPIYLTIFQTNDSTAYDEHHCLKQFNEFTMYHNNHLQQAIEELKRQYPNAIIVYGDYYNAFWWLLRCARHLGFDANSIQKACCGIGGDYKFSLIDGCGDPEVKVCPNLNQHISWDGVHLTQQTYMTLAG